MRKVSLEPLKAFMADHEGEIAEDYAKHGRAGEWGRLRLAFFDLFGYWPRWRKEPRDD